MKTLLLAGATLALLTAVNFSPAMAQEPKLSGGNTWAGISQRVDTSGRCRQNGTAGRGSPGGRIGSSWPVGVNSSQGIIRRAALRRAFR
jgi:hypothetical protein